MLGDNDWSIQGAVRKVVNSACEFAQFLNPRKATDGSGFLEIRWKMPKVGVTKLNVDGSYSDETQLMCTGGLLRSHQGEWISSFTTREGAGDALLAELLAVKKWSHSCLADGSKVYTL